MVSGNLKGYHSRVRVKGAIGRPPMFEDKPNTITKVNEIVKWLRENHMDVTLHLIIERLKLEINLKGFSEGAIKQAVYKIVRAEEIVLDRGKAAKK